MVRKILSIFLCAVIVFLSLIPSYIPQVQAASYPTYGVVNFRTKSCNATTSYTTEDGYQGYTNGCSGADAAFLGIENGKVKFKLSGVVGYVDPSEVEVRNMDPETPTTYISNYRVENGELKHYIQEDVNTYVQYPLIYSTQNKNEERVAVFLKYTSDTKDKYYGYTNLLYNSVGGTHVNYISKLLCDVWKEYINNSKIKLEVELKPTDVLVGLRCIVAVFISEPEFSSQTKEKLSVPRDYFNKFSEALKKQILSSLKFNDKQSKALIKRFEEYRISQNKLLSRKQISSLIKVNEDSPDNIRRRSVVTKLTECTSKNRKDTELYIVEGTSACGPAKRTRNKNLQAILELRGKILNVTGMTPKQAIKSQEVCNIVNSIGAGIGEQCNSKRSRYDRIYINCDGDEDGLHINCLVLSVFVNLLPDIIKDGRLYTVVPPLYGWEDEKGKKYYGNHIEEIPKGTKFTRFKGLGEMDDDEYYETCLNPKTRKVVQLEYPTNVDEFNRILGTAGGKADLLKNLGIIRDDRDWSSIEK